MTTLIDRNTIFNCNYYLVGLNKWHNSFISCIRLVIIAVYSFIISIAINIFSAVSSLALTSVTFTAGAFLLSGFYLRICVYTLIILLNNFYIIVSSNWFITKCICSVIKRSKSSIIKCTSRSASALLFCALAASLILVIMALSLDTLYSHWINSMFIIYGTVVISYFMSKEHHIKGSYILCPFYRYTYTLWWIPHRHEAKHNTARLSARLLTNITHGGNGSTTTDTKPNKTNTQILTIELIQKLNEIIVHYHCTFLDSLSDYLGIISIGYDTFKEAHSNLQYTLKNSTFKTAHYLFIKWFSFRCIIMWLVNIHWYIFRRFWSGIRWVTSIISAVIFAILSIGYSWLMAYSYIRSIHSKCTFKICTFRFNGLANHYLVMFRYIYSAALSYGHWM